MADIFDTVVWDGKKDIAQDDGTCRKQALVRGAARGWLEECSIPSNRSDASRFPHMSEWVMSCLVLASERFSRRCEKSQKQEIKLADPSGPN